MNLVSEEENDKAVEAICDIQVLVENNPDVVTVVNDDYFTNSMEEHSSQSSYTTVFQGRKSSVAPLQPINELAELEDMLSHRQQEKSPSV